MAKKHQKTQEWKSNIEDTLAYIKAESVSIASEMGVKEDALNSWKDIPKAVHQFSRKNASPSAFIRNLDKATYEVREKLKWNTCMVGQLALGKIKKKYFSKKI